MSFLDRFKRKKDEKQVFTPTIKEQPVKLEIVNAMHQSIALMISEIARVHPNQFNMIKFIITEYAFLIEYVLNYRKTGEPKDLFMKLQEFMIRSVKGYLDKYEDSDDIVEEDELVIKAINSGLATVIEQIESYEGIVEEIEIKPTSIPEPTENWRSAPVIKKKGGMPSPTDPVTSLKGIGKDTAKQLKDIGIETVEQYIEYQKAQSEAEDMDKKENE